MVAAPVLVEAGAGEDAVRIEIGESIQVRVEAIDLRDVGFG